MESDLRDKVAIVTGGASGIGRATCLALAAQGACLGVVDVNHLQATSVVRQISGDKANAIAVEADVSNEGAVDRAVAEIIRTFGRIDILVNNAAIEILTPMVSVKVGDWDKVLNTNLRGTFLFTRAVLPHMLRQKSGTIINVGSIDGLRGRANGAAYAASKAGVVCFTESLADEVAKYKIRANVICPAGVNTAMWRKTHPDADPLSVLQPEEVADMIVLLASDQTRMLNGATIEILGPRLEAGTYL
jgi:NAD(P)-dependent dehydrogenase (short-subunit alcohol dehydrogenase family)